MHYFSIERKYFPDFISRWKNNALLQKRSNLEYCSVFLILNYNSLIQLTKYGLPGKNRKIDCNRSQKDWCESQSQVLSKWQMTIWKNICGRPPPSHRERDVCYATLILVQLRITDWRDVHSVFLFCIMFVVTQKGGLL